MQAKKKFDYFKEIHPTLTEWRRDFHAHPELGFLEFRTSDLVARRLESFGCEVHRGLGGTGIVGVLRNGHGKGAIGLRAEMDALPIHEENAIEHRSRNHGIMHACGHDGHTTMLLGAAKYLAETQSFDGAVHFIFQPAEEGLGGARAMIADGLFERFPCDSIFGLHNKPGLAVGKFSVCPGPMMAGGAFFDIILKGKGGHAAKPHENTDLVSVACQLTTMLQTIVPRHIDPAEAVVVSVTSIDSPSSYNVMPEEVTIKGTARAFGSEALVTIHDKMQTIAHGVASAGGASASMDFRRTFAPLINNPEETSRLADVAAGIVGQDNVRRDRVPTMASEDFCFMLELCPGAFMDIGNGVEAGSNPVHTPHFDFNDDALPFGSSLLASVVEDALGEDA